MYESVRSRIAALEEEEVHGEEEERTIGMTKYDYNDATDWLSAQVHMANYAFTLAEEARKAVKGVPDSAIHTKYIELVRVYYSSTYPGF